VRPSRNCVIPRKCRSSSSRTANWRTTSACLDLRLRLDMAPPSPVSSGREGGPDAR
jgi:hypothetical protein